MEASADAARKRWEIENNVEETDEMYKFDSDENDKIREAEPWKKEYALQFTLFFKLVCILSISCARWA
jgi:hypothetical protein